MRAVTAVAILLVFPLLGTADDKPVKVKLGKFSAEAPAEWKTEKVANRLRSFQFKLVGEKAKAQKFTPAHTLIEMSGTCGPCAGQH